MARTKTTTREVGGHAKPPIAGTRKSPRVGQSERGVAGQSKEKSAGPSRVPEGDNPEFDKPVGELVIEKSNWPPRKQKFSSYSKLDSISTVRGMLEHQAEEALFREGCFSHFLDMPATKFNPQLLRHLILRQSKDAREDELVFNIEGHRLVFDIRDFAVITGLNCGPLPFIDTIGSQECRLLKRYFKGKKICRRDFNVLYDSKMVTDVNDKVKLSNLYILLNLVNAKQEGTQVELEHMAMVDNDEQFHKYPWGRLSYQLTIKNMKSRLHNIDVSGKGISGFPYAILIWAYETIPLLKARGYGARVARTTPRILNWSIVEQPSWDELEEAVFSSKKFTVQQMSILTRDLRRTGVNQAINEVQNKKDQVDPLSLESDRARIFESSGNISLIDEDPIAIRIEKKVDFLTRIVIHMYKSDAERRGEVPDLTKFLMDFHDDDARVENQDLRKEPNKDRSDDESESTPIPNNGDNEDDQGTPSPTHDSYNSFEQGDEISDTPSTERTLGENLESIDVLLSESCRPIILDTQITNQDANVTEVNPEETNPKDLSKSQTTSGPITPTISTQIVSGKGKGKAAVDQDEYPSPGRKSLRLQKQLEHKQMEIAPATDKGNSGNTNVELNPTKVVLGKELDDQPANKKRRTVRMNVERISNVQGVRPKRTLKKSTQTSDPYTTKFGSAGDNKGEGNSGQSKDKNTDEPTTNQNQRGVDMPSFELLSQP